MKLELKNGHLYLALSSADGLTFSRARSATCPGMDIVMLEGKGVVVEAFVRRENEDLVMPGYGALAQVEQGTAGNEREEEWWRLERWAEEHRGEQGLDGFYLDEGRVRCALPPVERWAQAYGVPLHEMLHDLNTGRNTP